MVIGKRRQELSLTQIWESYKKRYYVEHFFKYRIVPHPRTLRKTRENVKHMVADGVSRPKIRSYLFRWLCWWATTSSIWKRSTLLIWFIKSCWDKNSLQIANEITQHYFKELHTKFVFATMG